MRVELIDFREPEDAQLYVTRIKWNEDKWTLHQLLHERFSPHGLLHCINAGEDSDSWYAYINFYSVMSAENALLSFNNCLIINGQACRVVQKTRSMLKKGRMLYLNQCEDLANFYLGFNGWSSEILYHQKEEELEQKITFATAIRLTFSIHDEKKSVEGVGLAEAEFANISEKNGKMAMAQKCSRNAATLNAFSKVILAMIHNDSVLGAAEKPKVTIRIDGSRKDPFYYNSLWDSRPEVENVNELDNEPEFEK